jgi:predicted nuclease of restriction endonuclease-like RecB superfamily
MSEREKDILRDRWSGRGNPAFGKTPKHGPRTHWHDYAGIKLRSQYEVRFAKVLDARGIKWKYEPKRFDLGDCTYLPDFYLPERGEYWEVKGWMDPSSRKRIERFRELFPDTPLIVANQSVIEMMEN